MSATQTIPAVVPVAPVVAVAPVVPVVPVAPGHRPRCSRCSRCSRSSRPSPRPWPHQSAQKCQLCARKVRKRGFRRDKTHKNPDFVLEMPENGGSEGQKSTKTSILCSKCPKTGVPEGKSAQKSRFCAREEGDWHQGERKLASGSIT